MSARWILAAVVLENSEQFNIDAGVVKREETPKSYDGLFTDAFVE